MFRCKRCEHLFESEKVLIDHIRYTCKQSALLCPPFECGEDHCLRSFKTIWSLKRHVVASHTDQSTSRKASSTQNDLVSNSQPVDEPVIPREMLHNFEHFLLNMFSSFYKNPQIPRNSVQFITLEIQTLLSHYTNIIRHGINVAQLDFESIASESLLSFQSLNSEYKRMKKFKELGTLVCPMDIPLGSRLEYEHHSGKTNQLQSVCTMQVVPLRDVLVQFFSLKNVLVDTIAFLRSLANSDNPIENITQGSVWLNMKDQFDIQQDAIFYMPLIVYYDDFETNNPLGSHNVIQKLGGIYVSLPCLPKKYSSLLSNILLFGLFHASDRLTFGNNVVFHNIIEQLNDLQENGIKVKYCEFDVVLKFKVVCLTGDNLGLNGILGFVENFNAAHCCRICYANKEERQTNFYENAKLLRTKNKYLEDLHLKEDVATKGIKEPCAWLALKGFDPFEHVSVDALHDAFEGCCRYVMTFVASYLLENSLVKIEVLQNRLQSFDYGPDNSSRPVNAISSVSSSKALIRTSASEMITLMRYFPLIIGDHVPRGNDVWETLLLLKKILNLICTHRVFKENIPYLENAISEFCSEFKNVYKSHLPPKFHFLTHYPRMLLKFGPILDTWTMRFEAKHRVMKIAGRASSNKINICKTIALRNQLTLNSLFRDENPFSFFRSGLKKPISNLLCSKLKELFCVTDDYLENYLSIKWFKSNGAIFKEFSILLVTLENDEPIFAQVINIFIHRENDKILFYAHQFENSSFDPHYFAYEVDFSFKPILVKFDQLYEPVLPHTLTQVQDRLYITSRVVLV